MRNGETQKEVEKKLQKPQTKLEQRDGDWTGYALINTSSGFRT